MYADCINISNHTSICHLNRPFHVYFQLIKSFYNKTYTERNGEPVDDYSVLFLWSITTAIYFPGGMMGAYIAGFLADRLGRYVDSSSVWVWTLQYNPYYQNYLGQRLILYRFTVQIYSNSDNRVVWIIESNK